MVLAARRMEVTTGSPNTAPTQVHTVSQVGLSVIGNQSMSLGFTPSVGNTLLVVYSATAGDITTVTGTGLGSITTAKSRGSGSPFLEIVLFWVDVTSTSSSSFTLNLNGSFTTNGYACTVAELSGVSGKSIVASNIQSSSAVTNTPTATAVNPTGNGQLVIAAFSGHDNNSSVQGMPGLSQTTIPATGWRTVSADPATGNRNNTGGVAYITQYHGLGTAYAVTPNTHATPNATDTIGLSVRIA